MRQTYIVSYDVCCPKRWRKVFKTMRGYGDGLQLSVFRCDLSRRELVELREKLRGIINHAEDRILFVDVGPAEGRGRTGLWTMGRKYEPPEALAVVV